MMRKAYLIIAAIVWSNTILAQQQGLYSQYMFNLFAINPAWAGEADALATSLTYRAQWVGFEGNPTTQLLSIHSPLPNKNMAVGLNIQNDEIGARKAPSIAAAYSYKARLSTNRHLSFGLQAGIINYQYRWQDLQYRQRTDPVSFTTDGNKWIPSFDAGAMYIGPNSYIGLSATSINNSSIIASSASDARLRTFFNLVAARIWRLSDDWALKPGFLLRKSLESPYQADLNLSTRFRDLFWLTATYRSDFGAVFSTHIFVNRYFHFGYSYDLPLNDLLSQQSGTHELFIGYDFNIYKSEAPKLKPF